MNPQPPTARLMGRGGELAGSTFELGTDSTIGRDEGGRVAVNAPSFRQRYARIFQHEGSLFLEDLGGEGRTRLDGNPVTAPTRLGRLHVIELGDGMEAVFTQVAPPPGSAGTATEAPGAAAGPGAPSEPTSEGASEPATPPPAPPPPPASSPPGADPGHTVLDMAGFGALPDLPRGKSPPAEAGASEDASAKEEEPPAEKQDAPGDAGVDPGHTVLDMAGFGALPDLGRKKAESEPAKETGEAAKSANEDQESAPDSAEPAAAAPPGDQPAGPDPGQTILDMAGFGGLPDLSRPQDADAGTDDPQATRAVPRPPRFELAVDLPGRGPTTFPLKLGDNVLGRSEDCDITIFDPEMWLSRRHAIVRIRADAVELEDLKGVNGTFVDGKRIDTVQLTPGSTFSLGPHLTFTLQEK